MQFSGQVRIQTICMQMKWIRAPKMIFSITKSKDWYQILIIEVFNQVSKLYTKQNSHVEK